MDKENDNKVWTGQCVKSLSMHYPAGPNLKKLALYKAESCIETNELEAIYHLVESHVPSLRLKTVLRYEKNITSINKNQQCLSKTHIFNDCSNITNNHLVDKLLAKIKEMPEEWTLIQLTPRFNAEENIDISEEKHYTNSLYLSVFNCGENQPKPFCVNIEAPRDSVTGNVIPLMNEMHSITVENKNILYTAKNQTHFRGVKDKQSYYDKRHAVDDRLKMVVKELQDLYLKEWKCFFVGKYEKMGLQTAIDDSLHDFLKTELPDYKITEKTLTIMGYIINASHLIKLTELRSAIESLFPSIKNKLFVKKLMQFIRDIANHLALHTRKRHPIILIIEDSLDSLPWEMMEILSDSSVTRLPSIHLAYALYQEHKNTIKNGYKIVENPRNGTYILNPDLDLKSMQNRIYSFYQYWVPEWKGIAGEKPTEEKFEELLISGNIFAYNGHGSGAQFIPLCRIEKLRIKAIVLLLGCSSGKLNMVGPQCEMYSAYQMYLIACSPCVIGFLWEVTDLDTDILSTEFLCRWIPNTNQLTSWKNLDKTEWQRGKKVEFKSQSGKGIIDSHEADLSKALHSCKKSSTTNFFITKAGIVARGIPVKTSS